MSLLASFNSYPPPAHVLYAGLLAGVTILFMAGFARSILAGTLGTGISWAAVTWIVFSHETGDMRGLGMLFYTPFFFVLGCILGALVSFLGKRLTRRPSSAPVD